MFEIENILKSLTERRPIFHSEADFQHAFAWEIHLKYPEAEIRIEKPIEINGETFHLDIWTKIEGYTFAFELKYKKRKIKVVHNNELYNLKEDSARDCGRYDFLLDVERLEKISTKFNKGYAVLLTNDNSYWIPPLQKNTQDIKFRLHEGAVLKGELGWSNNPSPNTIKGRERPIILNNEYVAKWNLYSNLSNLVKKYGEFKYLYFTVSSK